jgi:hypothetical protein
MQVQANLQAAILGLLIEMAATLSKAKAAGPDVSTHATRAGT